MVQYQLADPNGSNDVDHTAVSVAPTLFADGFESGDMSAW